MLLNLEIFENEIDWAFMNGNNSMTPLPQDI